MQLCQSASFYYFLIIYSISKTFWTMASTCKSSQINLMGSFCGACLMGVLLLHSDSYIPAGIWVAYAVQSFSCSVCSSFSHRYFLTLKLWTFKSIQDFPAIKAKSVTIIPKFVPFLLSKKAQFKSDSVERNIIFKSQTLNWTSAFDLTEQF